ncbi:MAG: DUF350 domain-containing protein [Planctomycetota bacterium]|nr:MAG: DUF350 domain-containing protein [Planctomycetota bacterium]
MEDFWQTTGALFARYAYGIGWLVICIVFTAIGFKVFDRLTHIDLRAELEKGNVGFGILVGLYLLGLTFGCLYFAAHIS